MLETVRSRNVTCAWQPFVQKLQKNRKEKDQDTDKDALLDGEPKSPPLLPLLDLQKDAFWDSEPVFLPPFLLEDDPLAEFL